MFMQKLYSRLRHASIKLSGYLTGLLTVAFSLGTTYLYIIFLAAKAIATAPLFFNRLTIGLLRLVAFLPLPISSVVAANLTPFVVAAITIATPLFILFAFSISATFKAGTIPGEAVVVGGEPMILGALNGIKVGLKHVVRRTYELFVKNETTNLVASTTDCACGHNDLSDDSQGGSPSTLNQQAVPKAILNMFNAATNDSKIEPVASDISLNIPQTFAVTLQTVEQAREVVGGPSISM